MNEITVIRKLWPIMPFSLLASEAAYPCSRNERRQRRPMISASQNVHETRECVMRRFSGLIPAFLMSLTMFGCVSYYQTNVREMHEIVSVTSPAKIHLRDGSGVIFEKGFVTKGTMIIGRGLKYDLTRESSSEIAELPMNSIAVIECYSEEYQARASLLSYFGAICLIAFPLYFIGIGLHRI